MQTHYCWICSFLICLSSFLFPSVIYCCSISLLCWEPELWYFQCFLNQLPYGSNAKCTLQALKTPIFKPFLMFWLDASRSISSPYCSFNPKMYSPNSLTYAHSNAKMYPWQLVKKQQEEWACDCFYTDLHKNVGEKNKELKKYGWDMGSWLTLPNASPSSGVFHSLAVSLAFSCLFGKCTHLKNSRPDFKPVSRVCMLENSW